MGKIHAIVGAVAQTSCISDDTGHDMQLNVHVHVCGVLTTKSWKVAEWQSSPERRPHTPHSQ